MKIHRFIKENTNEKQIAVQFANPENLQFGLTGDGQVTENETDEGTYNPFTQDTLKSRRFFEYAHGMLHVTELTNEDK